VTKRKDRVRKRRKGNPDGQSARRKKGGRRGAKKENFVAQFETGGKRLGLKRHDKGEMKSEGYYARGMAIAPEKEVEGHPETKGS